MKKYTPFRGAIKSTSVAALVILICFAINIRNIREDVLLSLSIFVVIWCLHLLWTCRGYKIEFLEDRIILKELLMKNIEIKYTDLEKVSFEHILFTRYYIPVIYLFSLGEKYEFELFYFDKKMLFKEFFNICVKYNIQLDTTRYRDKKF